MGDALESAATFPNVSAKVSGLNTALNEPDWRLSGLRPSVETALECFGVVRLMCRSDWPLLAVALGVRPPIGPDFPRPLIDAAPEAPDRLPGGNAAHIYRFTDQPLRSAHDRLMWSRIAMPAPSASRARSRS